MPVTLATWEAEIRIAVHSQPEQIVLEILSQKYSTQKVAQVVECLPSK
jgi:hypothetical protein